MNKTFLFSVLLLVGCVGLSNHTVNQQCNFDKEVCQHHLTDFNDDRNKFQTDGAYLAVYDVTEHKYLEKLDTGIQNNRYKQKNIENLLNIESAFMPDEMLQQYIHRIKQNNHKEYAQTLKKLRENVETGTARNANSKNCMVYGLTATDSLDNNAMVATFLGHFEKGDKTYAIIVTFDDPKPLKSTYGFTTSGWNATKLAGKIINNICDGE
jgi:hypothetical protein